MFLTFTIPGSQWYSRSSGRWSVVNECLQVDSSGKISYGISMALWLEEDRKNLPLDFVCLIAILINSLVEESDLPVPWHGST